MIEEFLNFISLNKLFNHNDKILAAVSGGPDSVVLADLLHKTKFNFAIAHFNFKLRGKDSDDDEELVRNLAKKYNVQFFSSSADTVSYAQKKSLSIEMAARELRYAWFQRLCTDYGFTRIATAHNANDNAETILLNLSRKTGIKGLAGIPIKNGNIVRPLLFALREQIIDYCIQNNLSYRIDHTNNENIYTRNIIRNRIIPIFEEFSPTFIKNLWQSSQIIRKYIDFFEKNFEYFVKNCVFSENFIKIDKKKLLRTDFFELFLFEYLHSFGFSETDVRNIIETFDKIGNKFFSSTHILVIDRDYLIISEKNLLKQETIEVSNLYDDQIIDLGTGFIKVNISEKVENFSKSTNIAYFDKNKLILPLIFRHWQNGDYFYPFGMTQKKKLSDFFVDQKINLIEKHNIWILTSSGKITWLVGLRSDNRFRIDENTKEIVKMEYIKKAT